MIALTVLCIVLLASAACPYGSRGRLFYVLAKGAFLAIAAALLGALAALRASR